MTKKFLVLTILINMAMVALIFVVMQMRATGESPQAWWSGPSAGLWGGIGGSVIGLMGAAIGTLSSNRKTRTLVPGMMKGGFALGVFLLLVGGLAVMQSQPYEVYYPLLLSGLLCSVLFGTLLPVIQNRIRADELRQMDATDVC